MPLVDILPAPLIYCTGLATVDVIDTEVHCTFFQTMRDGNEASSPIVRAINLRLVFPLAAATSDIAALWAGVTAYRPPRMNG